MIPYARLAAKAAAILSATLVSAGCAYQSTTTFIIRNASSQTITVKTVKSGSDEAIEFYLEPGRPHSLMSESTKCPEDYIPEDKYYDGQIIPPGHLLGRLEIWVEERRLSEEVRVRENWDYYSTYYSEKYTLVVTDDMIFNYSESL